MQTIRPAFQFADKILWRIGYKNAFLGGFVAVATLTCLLMPSTTPKQYYTYKFFKRTKPTRYVYDYPY